MVLTPTLRALLPALLGLLAGFSAGGIFILSRLLQTYHSRASHTEDAQQLSKALGVSRALVVLAALGSLAAAALLLWNGQVTASPILIALAVTAALLLADGLYLWHSIQKQPEFPEIAREQKRNYYGLFGDLFRR